MEEKKIPELVKRMESMPEPSLDFLKDLPYGTLVDLSPITEEPCGFHEELLKFVMGPRKYKKYKIKDKIRFPHRYPKAPEKE